MNVFSSFHAIGRALSYRDFGIYAAGNAISLIGTWMQRLATGWLTWELTGSGWWLGVIAFADLFPTLVIGPIAGAAADRFDRLRMTKVTQSMNLLQALALFALTASGHITIWLLCALTALGGIIAAFNQPARLALVPSLVPRPDIVTAVAIVSIIFNLARFIGPAVAGVMIVRVGVAAAFAANAVTYAAFLFALTLLRASYPAPGRQRAGFLREVADGMRYAGTHQGIAAILLLTIVTSLFSRPIVELLPGFASEVFKSGAEGLAMLTSSIGIGAVVGGLWLGGRTQTLGLTRVALATSLAMAAAIAIFTATDRLWIGLPLLAVVGFCMSASGIASQTLVQITVPSTMRGRVLSLYGLIARGGPALGALAMGAASESLGFRIPVAVGGVIAAAAAIWLLALEARIAARLEQREPE
jgi:predicted MFS family arabinose efflux permease